MAIQKRRARFNVDRILADMTLRGWNNSDLATAAGVSAMTVTRFINGTTQTPKTGSRIAEALGHPVRRYFSHVEEVA